MAVWSIGDPAQPIRMPDGIERMRATYLQAKALDALGKDSNVVFHHGDNMVLLLA